VSNPVDLPAMNALPVARQNPCECSPNGLIGQPVTPRALVPGVDAHNHPNLVRPARTPTAAAYRAS
jgi:hypothetical protein